MPAARRLIINADDMGLTAGVNRAIAEAHTRGIVTSATLMANAPAFDDALNVAASNPKLSVGCHVTLLDGKPVLTAQDVSSLMDGKTDAHEFRRSLLPFAHAALRGRLRAEEIFAEATAQIRKLQAAGVRVLHMDTHKHAHIFPAVCRPLLKAARECGVRAVRNPFAPLKPLAYSHLLGKPRLWKRYTQVRFLRRYEADFRRAVAEHDMITPDGSFGIVVTGALRQEILLAILGCIPVGTWELVTHPGYIDDDLLQVRTRLRESRQVELEALTLTSARQALERHGVELISYHDLK